MLTPAFIIILIVLFCCISKIIKLKMEVEELKIKYKIQRLSYSSICQDYTKLLMKSDTPKPTTPDIKEAVHYAMIKAHPDNGGKQEDFVKFRNLYERVKNEYR